MPSGTIRDVGIRGIACAVPDNRVPIDACCDRFEKEHVDKFVKMTGIRSRHLMVGGQCVSDLCCVAAQRLLEHLDWDPQSVGALLFISSTPDYRLPATACVLQHRLGLGKDCAAFDMNLGCSSYPYGVWLASTLLQSSGIERALLLVGNQINLYIDPDDRATAMLFGDAGSATALERQEGSLMRYRLKTNGDGFRKIIVPAGGARNREYGREPYLHADGSFRSDYSYYLNGTDVFNFTITEVPEIISELLHDCQLPREDIDLYVLHQANLFILQRIAAKLKIPMSKVPVSIDRFGNTSGASLPLTLVTCAGDAVKDRLQTVLCGFGVGLSWGALSLEIDKAACLPLIYSNEGYAEGSPDHV